MLPPPIRLASCRGFCTAANVSLIFSGLSRAQEARYLEIAGEDDEAMFSDTLDDALQALEAELLEDRRDGLRDAGSKLLGDLLALSERPQFAGKFRRLTLNAGDVLLRQGAESREMFVLISGAMRAEVARSTGEPLVVARFMPARPSARSPSMATCRAPPPCLRKSPRCW